LNCENKREAFDESKYAKDLSLLWLAVHRLRYRKALQYEMHGLDSARFTSAFKWLSIFQVNALAPNRTHWFCRERGRHTLRGFSTQYLIDGGFQIKGISLVDKKTKSSLSQEKKLYISQFCPSKERGKHIWGGSLYQ
jgi:hypothetical protein